MNEGSYFPIVKASIDSAMTTGIMVGPLIGGYLYQWGGFTTPFLFTGSLMLLVAFLSYSVIPEPGT
jgi:predicted MFS family arabinose efflux permease